MRISPWSVAAVALLSASAIAPSGAFAPTAFAPPSSRTVLAAKRIDDSESQLLRGQSNDDDVIEPTKMRVGSMELPDMSEILSRASKLSAAALLALALTFGSIQGPPPSALATTAADSKAIVGCLLSKCQVPFLKCITNPNCLANVICINTCNGKADETGCQIECGNVFENDVVGEFNACAVSNMNCVPQKPDDGSYPVPPKEKLVQKFDTSLWNGRWYITAGQNELFDIFPCQVHFFTETSPGKFFGKLNWRIQEPDGEFFTRDALQRFVQDPDNPAHLVNHDNEYLHYEDDWYIVDYAADDNKEGVPPFAFVYYRGANDAWIGYGGVVVYTRDAKLPEVLIPRLREAAKKVNFDWDKDFTVTDNTCGTLEKGQKLLLREQFAGKMALQTEKQLQQQAIVASRNAANGIQAQKLFFDSELDQAEKAFEELEKKTLEFEKEIVKDVVNVEKEIVKDVVAVEKEIVKDVVSVEKEIVKDVVSVEKEIEKDLFGKKR